MLRVTSLMRGVGAVASGAATTRCSSQLSSSPLSTLWNIPVQATLMPPHTVAYQCLDYPHNVGLPTHEPFPSSLPYPFPFPSSERDAPASSLPATPNSAVPLWTMNRNTREPKKPNHGKRPCSNRRRKRKVRTRSGDHPFLTIKGQKGYDI